jgi:copine 1/2/3
LKNLQGEDTGTLSLNSVIYHRKPFLLEYLKSGWSLGMSAAIDFTESNGKPDLPNSLHRLGAEQPNDYEKAISAVTEILGPYIVDQKFPLYGFGGIPKYLKEKNTSHCFHLNGQKDAKVGGVDGLLKAYQNAIQNTTLGGPTNLSEVLGTFI